MSEAVIRVVRRRAKAGCEEAYEALIRAMFLEVSQFPGYLAAQLIPPEVAGGEYQVIQRFATEKDLDRWNSSPERATWHERLRAVAAGDPEYRLLSGLDVWFSPETIPATKPPPKWRMTVVSWMGIFPTVALLLWAVSPFLESLHFLIRTAIFTAMVAVLMSYIVMPRLSRWMSWWLRR